MSNNAYLPMDLQKPQPFVSSEEIPEVFTGQARFDDLKELMGASRPIQRPNRNYSIYDDIENAMPSAASLDRLVERFPAPKEWDDE